MEWASEDNPVEQAVDVAAAALFAAAVGFAAGAAGLGAGATIFAATATSLPVYAVLKSVAAGERVYALPAFEPAPLELASHSDDDELLLEDRLGIVTPDARVVCLFGPGQRSGGCASSSSALPDASQALTAALAELRRSLR
ncbi:MAG TPA: hypothetical protein VFU20_01860 [Sphingomicrobium sp.]|nr:hypothetical protein [Sphingomicrobium sp.]